MLIDRSLYAQDFCLFKFFWIALICCKNFKNLNIFRPWLIESLIFSATRKLKISLALVILAKSSWKLLFFLQIWGFHWVNVRVFHAVDVEIRKILNHCTDLVAAFRRTHQTCDGGYLISLIFKEFYRKFVGFYRWGNDFTVFGTDTRWIPSGF